MTAKTIKTVRANELKVGDVLDTDPNEATEVVESVFSESTEDGWLVRVQTDQDVYFHWERDEIDILV